MICMGEAGMKRVLFKDYRSGTDTCFMDTDVLSGMPTGKRI